MLPDISISEIVIKRRSSTLARERRHRATHRSSTRQRLSNWR